MHKRWIPTPTDEDTATKLEAAFAERMGIPAICARLLVQRGITTVAEVEAFFNPNWTHLHNPLLMRDMATAVTRLERAIHDGETIMLYGDYDVDGTTSVALMHDYLAPRAKRIEDYIPDRYREGYGVSMASIDYARAQGVTLIVAMDCGIKAHEPVALARSYGIDFIICDHHVPADTLPEAVAVLDPKREDCLYPFKELSGCGIAFKLVQALHERGGGQREDLASLLDLVAVSIACDMVLMRDENRALATLGIQRLNAAEGYREGLRALFNQKGRMMPVSTNDILFGIGPLINAAGRLGDAKLAVRAMLATNAIAAADLAADLARQNDTRREVEANMMREAEPQYLADFAARKSIVLFQPNWHKGVVGIIAARLCDQLHRPVAVLTETDGMVAGSVRSVRGLDVYETLKQCADLLDTYGGHPYAAGLTMLPHNVPAFRERFEAIVSRSLTLEDIQPEILVNAELPLEAIDATFYDTLRRFTPFGTGNPRPVFYAQGVRNTGETRLSKNGEHLLLHIAQNSSAPLEGVGYGWGYCLDAVSVHPFDICYVLEENNVRRERKVRFQIRDLRFYPIEI